MRIDTKIEKTPHPSINRLACGKVREIKETLLRTYLEKGKPRDFRKIVEFFESRPVRFIVINDAHKFIFEECGMKISWCTHDGRAAPLVSISYRGKPRIVGDLSFFGDYEVAYQGASFRV